jgi:GMP synthase (glutamine-hydrolysing)
LQYIYIIKTGETFETTKAKFGDFDSWVGKVANERHIKTIDVKSAALPNLKSAKGFIITGSHSMVTDESAWSLKLEKYIKKIASKNIPLLGICYGHQLIAKALGGKSGYNKKGKEIGTVKIKSKNNALKDPLFKDFPKAFYAYETHYQSVLKLPPKAVVLAKNSHDAHQAVRFAESIWGVQFHPEFDREIMAEYIMNQKQDLVKLGFRIDKLLADVRPCDTSSKIVRNFMDIVKQ